MKQILSWNDECNEFIVRYATKEEELIIKGLAEDMKKIKSLETMGLTPGIETKGYREIRDGQHRLIEKVRDKIANLICFNTKQYKLS